MNTSENPKSRGSAFRAWLFVLVLGWSCWFVYVGYAIWSRHHLFPVFEPIELDGQIYEFGLGRLPADTYLVSLATEIRTRKNGTETALEDYRASLKQDPILAKILLVGSDNQQKDLYIGDTVGWSVGTRIRRIGGRNFDSFVFLYKDVEFAAKFRAPSKLRVALDTDNRLILSTDTYLVVEGDRAGRWFPIEEMLVGGSGLIVLLAMSLYVRVRASTNESNRDA